MKKWPVILMSVAISGLTQSCSSYKPLPASSLSIIPSNEAASSSTLVHLEGPSSAPVIPFNLDKAFLPLRRDSEGKIVPSYQWRECKKSFIWCIEWKPKKVFFYDLEWFLDNGWGLTKRRNP